MAPSIKLATDAVAAGNNGGGSGGGGNGNSGPNVGTNSTSAAPMIVSQQQHQNQNGSPAAIILTKTDIGENGCDGNGGDGCNSAGYFFEGAEKRFCIQFGTKTRIAENGSGGGGGCGVGVPFDLRLVPRRRWEMMLSMVECQILDVITNDRVDAYLLSESSMFVANDWVMIKTCGMTKLLLCLDQLLSIAKQYGGDYVKNVNYSRKNYLQPKYQPAPHCSFQTECDFLERYFNGTCHLLGQTNGDHLFVYMSADLAMATIPKPLGTLVINNNHNIAANCNKTTTIPTTTATSTTFWSPFKFEMIMEHLDSRCAALFFNPNNAKPPSANDDFARAVTRKSGIGSLLPGMMINDYLFTPCGYSMNGLTGDGGHYMTIHITPEPQFSYCSVEMNVPQKSYPEFVRKVLRIFRPGKFMLNLVLPTDMMMMNYGGCGGGGDCGSSAVVVGDHHQSPLSIYKQLQRGAPFFDPLCCDNGNGVGGGGQGGLGQHARIYERHDLQLVNRAEVAIIFARYTMMVDKCETK